MAGLRPYVEQAGTNAHRALGYAYASLGLKTPFGGGGADGRLQISSDKSTNVNLITKAFDDIQHRALKEGERLGYEGRQLQAHVALKTAQFLNAWKEFPGSICHIILQNLILSLITVSILILSG